jgi:hypothetical protein
MEGLLRADYFLGGWFIEQFSNTLLYARLCLVLQHLSDLTVQRHSSVD